MDHHMASFRDPEGALYQVGERIFRRVNARAPVLAQEGPLVDCLKGLQNTGHWIQAYPAPPDALQALESAGLLDSVGEDDQILEHPRVFFPSYPHEWCPSMLAAAGEHTLAMAKALLRVGFELKDGTPTNVLFEGHRPVFVGHLSPVLRKAGQMGWTAYGQFVRTFIIPLILHKMKGLPISWMYLARRDGIAPEDATKQLTLVDSLRPSVFGLVTLPALLSRRQRTDYPSNGIKISKSGDETLGHAVTAHILNGLSRRVQHWNPTTPNLTFWSSYDELGASYTQEGLDEKERFVRHALEVCRPRTVMDLGCNTGRYSRLAAKSGARVLAVDGDTACVERTWMNSIQENLDILPLVIDLGRPSPALGWENKEESSFLARVAGRFEMIFALALVHHLLVRERLCLVQLVSHLARQTTRHAVIEWVPPEDPQFQKLAGPNINLYTYLDRGTFENALSGSFRILAQSLIPGGGRSIYLLEKAHTRSTIAPQLD